MWIGFCEKTNMTVIHATPITNASMTRSELVERISRQHPKLTRADVATAVAVILDAITATLAAKDRVEIRDFGCFSVNYRQPRIGQNPKTGKRSMCRQGTPRTSNPVRH